MCVDEISFFVLAQRHVSSRIQLFGVARKVVRGYRALRERSGLSRKVAPNFKKKRNVLQYRRTKETRRFKLNQNAVHSKVKTAIVTMSTVDKPTRYMRTRGGAEAKMAKIMKSLRSGGVETDSDLEEPSAGGGHATVVSANNEEKNVEDTQPSIQTQTTANGTRAAKKKPGKKASKTKNPKVTKKSSASKEVDAAVRKAVVSKLAELEDIHLKKNEAACSSHPREWTGEVPGNYVL